METAAVIVGAIVAIVIVFRVLSVRTQRRHDARAEALAMLGVPTYPEALGRADLSGDAKRIAWELVEAVLRGPRGAIVDWRASPTEVLATLAPPLQAATGAVLEVDGGSEELDADGVATVDFCLTQGGATTRHRARRHGVDESTHTLVAGVTGLVDGAEGLAAVPYEQTDTGGYVIVTRKEHARIRTLLADRYAWTFAPVTATGAAIAPAA